MDRRSSKKRDCTKKTPIMGHARGVPGRYRVRRLAYRYLGVPAHPQREDSDLPSTTKLTGDLAAAGGGWAAEDLQGGSACILVAERILHGERPPGREGDPFFFFLSFFFSLSPFGVWRGQTSRDGGEGRR